MARLAPLAKDAAPELAEDFAFVGLGLLVALGHTLFLARTGPRVNADPRRGCVC